MKMNKTANAAVTGVFGLFMSACNSIPTVGNAIGGGLNKAGEWVKDATAPTEQPAQTTQQQQPTIVDKAQTSYCDPNSYTRQAATGAAGAGVGNMAADTTLGKMAVGGLTGVLMKVGSDWVCTPKQTTAPDTKTQTTTTPGADGPAH